MELLASPPVATATPSGIGRSVQKRLALAKTVDWS
jgi:hypothetical protein